MVLTFGLSHHGPHPHKKGLLNFLLFFCCYVRHQARWKQSKRTCDSRYVYERQLKEIHDPTEDAKKYNQEKNRSN